MSDGDRRELERALAASPIDVGLRERLERAWLRDGLGWHGEKLPRERQGFWPSEFERGVYFYSAEWTGGFKHDPMQFVYVPAGEMKCVRCQGRGTFPGPINDCPDCEDGFAKIEPFYLGRFPVTWRDWTVELGPGRGYDPVTKVAPEDARVYCWETKLRLPSINEWVWAALGAGVPCRHPVEDSAHSLRVTGNRPR